MPELSLEGFLKDLGLRIGAGAVVAGIFFGLGYLNRTDFLGLSGLLGTGRGFYVGAFLLVGLVALGWVAVQQYRH